MPVAGASLASQCSDGRADRRGCCTGCPGAQASVRIDACCHPPVSCLATVPTGTVAFSCLEEDMLSPTIEASTRAEVPPAVL